MICVKGAKFSALPPGSTAVSFLPISGVHLMVSGWDKYLGPGNDYASKPWPKSVLIAFGIFLIVGPIALVLFVAI